MKYFFSFLFAMAILATGFSQEQVIGRSMVLKTNGHPDSIPSLTAPAVNFGNAVVLDTVSGNMYTFNYATEAWQKMVSENSAEARPYKVYLALISQKNAANPTVRVLENTLGEELIWTYDAVGTYYAETALATTIFTDQKCYPEISISTSIFRNFEIELTKDSESRYRILSKDSVGVPADSKLNLYPIEIRVYE